MRSKIITKETIKFRDLGLSEQVLKAIDECGYDTPTPIQAEAIPHVLMMRDVVGLAQTGTGKTAGFTLPMIEILDGGRAKARMPRSLILSPTRELAAQIAENFETYGKYTSLSMALLVGGTSMAKQVQKLDKGVDVLIATPGRLMDLFDRGQILLNDIKVFVIDEADRMLDMGFIPDIDKIASLLPPMRQTLLFSATMAPPIKKLTEKFLSNPREVSVSAPATTATNVEQNVIWATRKTKDGVLLDLLKAEDPGTAFIFCNRKRDIDGLVKLLSSRGYDAKALHGDMDQKSRTQTLDLLREGGIKLLVCSDVAGRGIDVDHITHVFNYDVPMQADDYVHRIGRTGRAGRSGKAFMFAVPGDDDTKRVAAIEDIIKKPIPVLKVDGGGSKPKSQPKPSASKPSEPRVAKSKARDDRPKGKSSGSSKGGKSSFKGNKTQDNHDDAKGFGDDIPAFLK